MKPRLHLVMRYSSKMYDGEDVISQHNRIALRQGGAWLGKADHGMGRMPIMTMNEQIMAGELTRLFLIDVKRIHPIGYFGDLLELRVKSPTEKELIPSFYRKQKILHRMKVWLKVSELQGFTLRDYPPLDKAIKHYELAISFADLCSEYFILRSES